MATVHAASGALAVDIRDLDVSFATDGGDVHAVRGVTLDVRRGEVLAIVGESGSGKTVTSRTILGLLPETARMAGAVVLDGTERRQPRQEGAARGARHQGRDDLPGAVDGAEPGLHRGLAARRGPARTRQVHQAAGAHPRDRDAAPVSASPTPERRVDDYPHQFSGGQKQRIVIAMALALEPDGDHRRRADDGARRDGAGRDPRSAAAPARRGRHRHRAHHAQHGRRGRPRRSRRRHARRRDRRDGDRRRTCSPTRSTSTREKLLAAVPRLEIADRQLPAPSTPVDAGRRRRRARHRVRRAASAAPAFRAVDRRQLHDRARRGAGPRRRERLGQDDDRPRDRRPHAGRRRVAAGARHRDARGEGARVPRAAQGARLRLPGPGDELQPAADDRAERRRAAHRAHGVRGMPRPPGRRSTSCSKRCSCRRRSATGSRTSCPADSVSAPRSRARSRSTRSC